MTKNLFVAYVLWFFFGWSGLHHFYLGRDKQAFVWWSTLGGVLYLGWIRDFWRIPEYVEDANDEPDFVETFKRKVKLRKAPPFNSSRCAGEVLVGCFYGLLMRFAVPQETPFFIQGALVCLSMNMGVYLVGNIGREEGPFVKPLLSTMACYTLLSFITGEEATYIHCVLSSAITFNYLRQYRKKRTRHSVGARVTFLFCGGVVVTGLWCSFFYFNASITFQNGETITFRESVNHFFKSPAWLDFKNILWKLYEDGRQKSWEETREEFIRSFDPTGETNACKVLNVSSSASENEIRTAYKKLVVKWHPDRYQGKNKEEAEKQFIEVQRAYEILRKRRKSSTIFNEKDRTEF